MALNRRRVQKDRGRSRAPLSPTDFHVFAGEKVPDPITFVVGEDWCNRSNLYPRQATLLKVIFLREDLFTDYDYEVVAEWEESFKHTGNNGITPGILERMRYLKAEGYPWFREVLLVLGRRAGKGYVAALAMAYVLWTYLAMGDPQGHFGVDRDKKLACFIYAGKKDQATKNLWGDLNNVIKGAPCFSKYISRSLGESISVYAPNDFARMRKQEQRGIDSAADMATFLIEPKEATLMSGRGPTSFCLDPETPVLTSDLTWVPIKDLRAGDRVVGVDEYPTTKGAQRKMRDAQVIRVWKTRKTALRLTFDDGTDVVCSPDHKWLFKDSGKGGGYLWRESAKLRPGARIRHLVDPWTEDRSWEAGYLAGIFDGEGCVSGWQHRAGKSVLFTQNRGEVLDATLAMLEDKGFQPRHFTNSTRDAEQWSLGGTAESMAFLGSIRPVRLFPKHKGVWEGVAPRGGLTPSGRARSDAFKTIVSIEELPEQDLIDIETTTHTFIANGFISHNCQGYDEMAHVVATGANRSAEDIYGAATPALDQFKKYAFIIEPSSPWQQVGQFYLNWQNSLLFEDGVPAYPQMMMLQLTSWEMYYDWADAHLLPLFPEGFRGDLDEYVTKPHPQLSPLKSAIQEFDEPMRRLEKANPDTFKVERRSQWQATVDAYLNADKITQMFAPWGSDNRTHDMQTTGLLSVFYKGHADPSLANANFGLAIGHPETIDGTIHLIFDYIHHFQPSDFPDNMIDYPFLGEHVWGLIQGFKPDEFTYDQWNSAETIQRLSKKIREANFPKRVQVYEKTATAAHNWERAENFKVALNQGWIHAPYYEQAELELKFLQLKNGKVVKQDAGPVQTKDVADCLMEVAWTVLGTQVHALTHQGLSNLGLHATASGGFDPHAREYGEDSKVLNQFSTSGRGRDYVRRGGGANPARNPLAGRAGRRR